MKMKLRFPECEIVSLAEEYLLCLSKTHQQQEQEVISIKDEVQKEGVGYLTREQLSKMVRWKSQRNSTRILNNSKNCIKKITRDAFRSTDDWSKLEILEKLEGIGYSIGSAILHLYDENPYPILDVRAMWSVCSENDNYTPTLWQEYIQFCCAIADRNNLSMRTLDRALWRFSYKNS